MGLIRPVTRTVISTATFGHPVYDWIIANTPTAWTALALTNGCANVSGFQTCQYRKIGDMVYLRGLVAVPSAGLSLTTLPAGFRPPALMTFTTDTFTSGRVANILQFEVGGRVLSEAAGNVGLSAFFSTIA